MTVERKTRRELPEIVTSTSSYNCRVFSWQVVSGSKFNIMEESELLLVKIRQCCPCKPVSGTETGVDLSVHRYGTVCCLW